MKVTIVGCGWLGLPLGEHFLTKGHIVSGTTRNQSKLKQLIDHGISPIVTNSEGELLSPKTQSTDVLIITIPPFDRENPHNYLSFIRNIIQQFDPKQAIFTSSTSIYPQQNGTYTEEFVFLEHEKSSILFRAESLVKDLNPNAIILRLGGLFGPERHPVKFLTGKSAIGNPFGRINFIHQQDVIEAISNCIEHRTQGIFNLVYPEHPYRKDYYTRIFRHYNLDPISFDSSSSIERVIPSDKIKMTIGFVPQRSINDLDEILS